MEKFLTFFKEELNVSGFEVAGSVFFFPNFFYIACSNGLSHGGGNGLSC